ncbi:MAG: hypothetical protein HXS54_06245 [Theionarchaea archaeon]|nr:hypothetical protein [Theionarchaea archaeon]DBA34859.1 TPA_asm: hypothetical protein vir521_00065 [Caudoviricetes sp. vir521]
MYSTYQEWQKLTWREILSEMGDNKDWDYVASLRGCDNVGEDYNFLKEIFTCYLRGKGSDFPWGHGSWDIQWFEDFFLSKKKIEKTIAFIEEDHCDIPDHWFIHTEEGLNAVLTIQEGKLKELTLKLITLLSNMFYTECLDLSVVKEEMESISAFMRANTKEVK